MPTEQDLIDLKEYISERIVAINIVELIEWYESRIRELEQRLREAHLNNAEKLFENSSDG
ncbi:hypothetical protein JQV19_06220 [Sulfitobacter mediterraneus]|uniref:hypothetical protein n=1 Tax=Sulfitobacter mediterraneus TaxID=83219 RepID=UPI001939E6D8|nr:hypothetical protein [Sulfitobacter mediterraneus]MBM1556244.1 hypothetical protein [Sulfitobacter mediterraneus]MBM1567718.1 hypothetical protein [Sulfitobacter mediterraneus]MBM1571598.1 hypothetical protein [Sulfitobacter mediterraneus]MBM1575386.1 hypothetical protein [Sulfitobacter mediterraneus]MBM1579123.1 hypothetical protein [Sulfitobacter mediterraneus]